MARNHGNSHVRFTLAESMAHRGTLIGIPLRPAVEERFIMLARESLEKQKKIELADRVDFLGPPLYVLRRRSPCHDSPPP